jgi:hypothetical protein
MAWSNAGYGGDGGWYKNAASGGGGLDPATTAWIAAVVSAGGTVSGTQQTNVDTLIKALKGHSLFSVQDRIWLHASENAQQATIDIVNLGVASLVGAPVFTAGQGYAGTGSTSDYLDSGYAGTTGPNFTQNSASVSSYVRTSSGFGSCSIGVHDATGYQVDLQTFFNTLNYDINNSDFANQTANTDEQGFWTISRTGASSLDVYKNGNPTPFISNTSSSIALSAFHMFLLARNQNNTSVDSVASSQISITTMGIGMSAANTVQFHTDLNAYMTALGANVYL